MRLLLTLLLLSGCNVWRSEDCKKLCDTAGVQRMDSQNCICNKPLLEQQLEVDREKKRDCKFKNGGDEWLGFPYFK